jgi:hypothetical protein
VADNRTRLAVIAVAGYLAVAAGYLPYFARQAVARDPDPTFGSDLTVFYTGWRIILGPQRRRIYDPELQRATQTAVLAGRAAFPGGLMAFVSPPHAAVLLAPLGWLPYRAVLWLWTAASVACLVALARGLGSALGPRAPPLARWLLVAALLAYRPVYETLQLGQLSIALALALWGIWVAIRRANDALAVACVVVLGLKPQLLPMAWVLLLVFGRVRALVASGVALAATAAASAALLGSGIWLEYARKLPGLEATCGNVTADFMLCLRGPLARALGPEHPAVIPIALAAQGAVLAWFVWAARSRKWTELAPARTFALGCALGLLFDAHLFMLDALLWVVPLALSHAELRERARPTFALDLFVLAWPMVFLLHEILEHSPLRPPVPLALLPMAAATAWLVTISVRPLVVSPQ